jgi:AraC-like DNA-binding protein
MPTPLPPLDRITFSKSGSYGKRICQPGWYWDHQIPFTDYDIFYVLAGQGEMSLGEEKFQLQRKSCLIMRPGDLPKATQDPDNRLTVLYMHFRISGNPDSSLSYFPFPRFTVVENAFQTETILYQLMELLEFPMLMSDLEYDCMMKKFFIHLFREQSSDKRLRVLSPKQVQKVREIMKYIRERSGIGIDWHNLAEHIDSSQQYVSRLFKASTGQTIKQFIAKTKMEHAQEMLLETRMSLSEIADYLGYSDLFAFSKSFKLAYGIAPSDYATHIRHPATLAAPPPNKNTKS